MKNEEKARIEIPFNPLDKKNLGVSVADAMLSRPVSSLPLEESFAGAGIYAIYYNGKFPAYRNISSQNMDGKFGAPIYVGKAVPAGARKGGLGLDIPPGSVLFRRIIEHANSIEQAKNLSLADFHCRFLVVDDIWIPLGESLLIEMFSPIWNTLIDGFGNHDPGGGRYNQMRSMWDTLHPGRSWAEKCKPNPMTVAEIVALVKKTIPEKF